MTRCNVALRSISRLGQRTTLQQHTAAMSLLIAQPRSSLFSHQRDSAENDPVQRSYSTSQLNFYSNSATTSGDVVRIGTDDPRMSRVVVHGGVVYMSGQTDTTADDIQGQTKAVLAKVDGLLAEAGTSKSNLLTASIWLKDIEADFKEMNAVWSDWVDPENKPVRATVQSPMARPQILVEIQVSATAE